MANKFHSIDCLINSRYGGHADFNEHMCRDKLLHPKNVASLETLQNVYRATVIIIIFRLQQ